MPTQAGVLSYMWCKKKNDLFEVFKNGETNLFGLSLSEKDKVTVRDLKTRMD